MKDIRNLVVVCRIHEYIAYSLRKHESIVSGVQRDPVTSFEQRDRGFPASGPHHPWPPHSKWLQYQDSMDVDEYIASTRMVCS